MSPSPEQVGRVRQLWHYPVKSMQGATVDRAEFDARGIRGDRLFAVHDAEGKLGSGKTMQRFVALDGIAELRPVVEEGELRSVEFPDGRSVLLDDPGLNETLSGFLGQPVTLRTETDTPHFDWGALHLLTDASLRWLSGRAPQSNLDVRRFRPNIVVDSPSDDQVERAWVGRTLAIGGDLRLIVRKLTQRCVMTNMAQAALPYDARVLSAIGQTKDVALGIYADVVNPGTASCGDVVCLLPD